jgi:ribosomal protein L2
MTAFLVHNFVNNFDNFGNFDKFMNQIRIEEPKFEHKNPIVKYIDEYKKQNNEYPKTLDEKVIKSRKIENIEYKPSKDGYKLEIKYKNGKKEELEHFENAQTEKNGNSYHYSFSFKSDND